MKRLSAFFLGLGVVIGAAALAALVLGLKPSSLPAAWLDIAVFKLAFVASACVLAAGALLGRAEKRRAPGLKGDQAAAGLAAGDGPSEPIQAPDDRVRVRTP